MPHPLLIFSQSDYLMQIVAINSYLMANSADPEQFLKKPTDLELHCLQKQGISGLIRTRVKCVSNFCENTQHMFSYRDKENIQTLW